MAVNLRESEVDDVHVDDEDCDVQEKYHGPKNGKAVRKHIANTFF